MRNLRSLCSITVDPVSVRKLHGVGQPVFPPEPLGSQYQVNFIFEDTSTHDSGARK